MSNQDSLFDNPVVPISGLSGKPVQARANDPKSSHDAAALASKNAHTVRAQVLMTLDDMGQATADGVRTRMREKGISVKDSSPRSRLKDLRDDGYARIVRHTNENQAVYATTDRGHTAAMDLRATQRQEAA